jgi:hypothetical protein
MLDRTQCAASAAAAHPVRDARLSARSPRCSTGFSVLYCMTTSLVHGGAGLGSTGLPPSRLQELAGRAGSARVRQVEMDNPFNILYGLWRAS